MSGKRKLGGYWWWPTDYMADEHVALMTLEQEGIYHRLLDLAWLHGSVPADIPSLARLVGKGMTAARLTRLWPGIAPCWQECEGRLTNGRMERERVDMEAFSAERAATGSRGGRETRQRRMLQLPAQLQAQPPAQVVAKPVAKPVAQEHPPSPSPSERHALVVGSALGARKSQKPVARATNSETPGAQRHRDAAQGNAHIADILPAVLPR